MGWGAEWMVIATVEVAAFNETFRGLVVGV